MSLKLFRAGKWKMVYWYNISLLYFLSDVLLRSAGTTYSEWFDDFSNNSPVNGK